MRGLGSVLCGTKRKDSYYAVYYRRVAARRGAQRALVAVMHKIVIAIWHVLHDHVPYHDLGSGYLTKTRPATRDPPHAQRSQQPRPDHPI